MPDAPVTVELTVDHYRISPENAGYHDLGDYPTHSRAVQKTELVSSAPPIGG